MTEQANYSLALILPGSSQLLGLAGPAGIQLPIVAISPSERLVQGLTREIEVRWNIRTIVLDILTCPVSGTPCAVIEVQSTFWAFERAGFSLVRSDGISTLSLAGEQQSALAAILLDEDANREPLARKGWLKQAQEWVQESVTDHDVEFTGDVFHVNGCAPFALVQFETLQGPDYWLKATGSPNADEFAVTRVLSQRFSNYLPQMVAAREDWNAWITKDAGPTLRERLTLPAVERAVTSLASLEKQSLPHIEGLRAAGCVDCGIRILESHVDELVDYLEEAMRLQSSAKVHPLDRHQLRELRDTLHRACLRMEELDLPETLIHGDINPGNILFDGSSCVFIDWAEAYTGNPFLNFEQFLHHVERFGEQVASWIPGLRALFKQQWLDLIDEGKIHSAFEITPLLAVAAYLYGRGDWLHSSRRNDANFQAFARGLARRMYRTALPSERKETLCQ
jgi:Phosphotransferase enzyme family